MNKTLLKSFNRFQERQKSGLTSMTPILIFDMMYMFKSNYAVRPIITESGTMLGGVAGALRQIMRLQRLFSANEIICVFDGKNHQDKRKKIYEDYKANRKKNTSSFSNPFNLTPEERKKDEEFQMQLLKHIVKLLPLKAFAIENNEADDLIGYLVKTYLPTNFPTKKIIVVSEDKDFIQLVDERVNLYFIRKKETINLNNYKQYWDTDYIENIIYIRCVEGDNSDGVTGVKGLKYTSLVKLIPEVKSEKIESIDHFIEIIEKKSDILRESKKGQSLLDSSDILRRNYKLMKLPMPLSSFTEMALIELMKRNEYNVDNMQKIVKTLVDYKLTDVIDPAVMQKFYFTLKTKM